MRSETKSAEALGEGGANKNLDAELKKTVEKCLQPFDEKAKIELETNGTTRINIISDQPGLFIGHFGQTLEVWQNLVRLMANKIYLERRALVVDAQNYKADKANELQELALQVAQNVKKSGYPQTLRPMNAYERRIVHTALNDFEGITTTSVGEEPARCIEIKASLTI